MSRSLKGTLACNLCGKNIDTEMEFLGDLRSQDSGHEDKKLTMPSRLHVSVGCQCGMPVADRWEE